MLRPDAAQQPAIDELTLPGSMVGSLSSSLFCAAQVLPPKSLPSQHHERLDAAREVSLSFAFLLLV